MRSKRMKKGQIAEGNVTTVEFPNKGIVMTDEGERVIVKNTIPGQRVSFAVNKVRKGKAEGRLLETVKKSPRETADTCRHFGQCGGCTYQSLPYEEQLKIKETQVRGMIEQAIGVLDNDRKICNSVSSFSGIRFRITILIGRIS